MPRYNVLIRKVEPVKVVSVRGVVPRPQDQKFLWRELGAYLAQQRIHPIGALAIYHEKIHPDRDWDIEVCQQVAKDMVPTDRIKAYSLPGIETMACVTHAGPLARIGAAYDAILKWLEENQYQIAGPWREIYIRAAYPDGNPNDLNTTTEIQYPVSKVGLP